MTRPGNTPDEALPRVAGYELREQIGSGGFSRVYRAAQERLARDVAIKVLNTNFEDVRQQRTFERECRVMGQLSTHPNIVTVFDSGLTERGRPCIVMELYQATYRDRGIVDIPTVVDVGIKVADALQAVHASGIVHRDIKPHNIFISAHGEPALGDFGISSLENERTITGGGGFSINYAAPEVFEEAGAGPAGDVYSLGATLFHLATGDVPFPSAGDEGLRGAIHRIISAPPPSLNRPDAPAALDRLLRRCMAKSPSERPASAGELATELRRIAQQLAAAGVIATPAPAVVPLQQRTPTLSADTAATDNVTFVRERTAERQPRVDLDEDADERSAATPNRQRVLVVAGLVLLLVVGSVVALSLGGGNDDPASTTTPTPGPTRAPIDLGPTLQAPTLLDVVDNTDGTYTITWRPSTGEDGVRFLVQQNVNDGPEETFDSSPASWETAISGNPCFRVRAVTEFAQSATWSNTICAG